MLEKGDSAPNFILKDSQGNDVSLSDFRGKWVVLYFYPRDNTSGCTKEARDFTDFLVQFKKMGAAIIGVSPDSVESHRRFVEKHGIGIILLSDVEKEILRAYGAWGKKKNYGREYEGVIRSTFLIDPKGRIAWVWKNVRVRAKRKGKEVKHAEIVFERFMELIKQRALR